MGPATQLARQWIIDLVRIVQETNSCRVVVELVAEKPLIESQGLLEDSEDTLRQRLHLTIEPRRRRFELHRPRGPNVRGKSHVGKDLPIVGIVSVVKLAEGKKFLQIVRQLLVFGIGEILVMRRDIAAKR